MSEIGQRMQKNGSKMSENSHDINIQKYQNFENSKDFYDIFVPTSYHVRTFLNLGKFISDILYPSKIFQIFLIFLCNRFHGLLRKIL